MRRVYIVAEAGQNHNGDLKLAKQLIDMTAMPVIDKAFATELKGVDAIKFTKRDMSEELTQEAYDAPYDSPHSFGKTYGQHRESLELSYQEHEELFHYATGKGLDFIETLTSPKTLKLLERFTPKYIKVASRDLTNVPLLERIAETKIPVILSSGMGGVPEIDQALGVIVPRHENIIIMHCVSQYPAEYSNLNLNSIPFLKQRYKYPIGYSDHSIGIMVPLIAFSLGADFIEKHITVSRNLKGSDHFGALEPDGLWRMTRDLRNAEASLGEYRKECNPSVAGTKLKLGRSLAIGVNKKRGECLEESDLVMLSPGGGLGWEDRHRLTGKKLKEDLRKNSLLCPDSVE